MSTATEAYSSAIATTLAGIRLSNGERVLEGLSNSFEITRRTKFLSKHRTPLIYSGLLLLIVAAQVQSMTTGRFDKPIPSAIFLNMGDVVALKKRLSQPVIEVDEIFGNEFVRKREVADPKLAVGSEDPRIGAAKNVFASGLRLPVDLTPDIQPDYPASVRARGVSGRVTLELVVGDDGSVLRARVARGVDPVLDRAAASAFRRKRYEPSRGTDGKPLTVRFYQPVDFTLN